MRQENLTARRPLSLGGIKMRRVRALQELKAILWENFGILETRRDFNMELIVPK